MSTTPALTPAPTLGPAPVAVPAVAPILAPPHPVGDTTTEHFPEMNPPLAPEDLPRPQRTWFPRAPSPAGGSAGRASECQAPREGGCQEEDKGKEEEEEEETKASVLFPSLYFTHKTPLLGFHPPFCVFHCS